ncbi:MAG TPA: hypothetical protein VFS18_05665, partial [Actinomycetota bacterium]|nr:hypothetical protein [Actinomycetota bacterium]
AALEATLQAHLEERVEDLPFWKFVSTSAASIEGRVRRIIASLEERLAGSGAKVEARPTSAVTGGGSLPGSEMASWSIAVADPERSAAELARRLRFLATPIVARVEDDVMLLDLRSVDPSEDDELADALFEVLG